jgi:serine/threonine protein phosphatase PrpC
MNIHYTTVTGRRDKNEDGHNIEINLNAKNNKNNINLFGIYDGHGGNEVSKFLEKKVPKIYLDKKNTFPFSKTFHINIFKELQKKILENEAGFYSGSTCIICILYKKNNNLYMNVLNLGDCRLVILYKNNKFNTLTIDHKPDEIGEKKRITTLGGIVTKDSEDTYRIGDLAVSRSFGDGDNAPYISQIPDIYYKRITDNTEYIVIACDGLWDVINNNELHPLIKKFKENGSKNLAISLVNEALKRKSCDNISVIVIEI